MDVGAVAISGEERFAAEQRVAGAFMAEATGKVVDVKAVGSEPLVVDR